MSENILSLYFLTKFQVLQRGHGTINGTGWKKKHISATEKFVHLFWCDLKTIWEEKLTLWLKCSQLIKTEVTCRNSSGTIEKLVFKENCTWLVEHTFQNWNLILPTLYTCGGVMTVFPPLQEGSAPAAEMIIRLGRLTPGYFRLLQVGHEHSAHKSIFSVFMFYLTGLHSWNMFFLFSSTQVNMLYLCNGDKCIIIHSNKSIHTVKVNIWISNWC